jgi:hypothetical protein
MECRTRLFIFLIGLFLIGCNKTDSDSGTLNDPGALASGRFDGDYTYVNVETVKAQIRITRITDSTINLSATIAGEHRYDKTVKVHDDGNGKIILFSEYLNDTWISGAVDGNTLQYMYGWTNQFEGVRVSKTGK